MLPTQTCRYILKRLGRSYTVFVQTDMGTLSYVRAYAKLADAHRDFPSAVVVDYLPR